MQRECWDSRLYCEHMTDCCRQWQRVRQNVVFGESNMTWMGELSLQHGKKVIKECLRWDWRGDGCWQVLCGSAARISCRGAQRCVRFSWVVLPVLKGDWLCCSSQSVWCQRRPAQPVCDLGGIGCDVMWHEIRSTRLFAEQAEHHKCHCAEREEESGSGDGCKSESCRERQRVERQLLKGAVGGTARCQHVQPLTLT